MQEFQSVGDILEDIAATDANVVIGTSIDKEMEGEIRVTVVATGLESEHARKPMRVVNTGQQREPKNYRDLDSPAHMRRGDSKRPAPGSESQVEEKNGLPTRLSSESPTPTRGASGPSVEFAAVEKDEEIDYLDLPTFLRRQAD